MPITAEEYKEIAAAIRAAEQRTSGQLVGVLARASSNYAHFPILWASALALVLPWPLIYLTQLSVERIFLAQLATFLLANLLFSWLPLRLLLVPRAVRRAQAHRTALEQFMVRNVSHTANRNGVLIFVSLAEHYARIIADEGIARRVPNAEWQGAIDALLAQVRDGRVAAGFIAAVEHCGAVLSEHAPPDGSPNQLPDRLYVM